MRGTGGTVPEEAWPPPRKSAWLLFLVFLLLLLGSFYYYQRKVEREARAELDAVRADAGLRRARLAALEEQALMETLPKPPRQQTSAGDGPAKGVLPAEKSAEE